MNLETSKVRLDGLQVQDLGKAVEKVNAKVYLFGSRIDLKKKGGDVDVFLVMKNKDYQPLNIMLEVTKCYQNICDERIDIIVLSEEKNMSRSEMIFFQSTQKVCLKD